MQHVMLKFRVVIVFAACVMFIFSFGVFDRSAVRGVDAQTTATPTPQPFNQAAAIAKLREQIKGREQEPASKVFKNVTTPMLKDGPAARLLAVMEFGYARSLGVDCTHCHVPDKWETEDRTQKQTARDMAAMMGKINGEMLKGIKNLKSASPTINCTTCHRGQVTPALNLPAPAKN